MNDFLVKTSGLSLETNIKQNSSTGTGNSNSVKTLMMLHGWGMNSKVWEPIRVSLEAQYHLILVDLPGHGFNRDVEAHSFEDIVDVIAEIVPKSTHIMGWSLGGLIAQALMAKIPERINSLTLVASTPKFSQSTLNDDWLHAMSESVLNRFAENLKQDTQKTLKGFIALQFIGVKHAKSAQDALISKILNGESIETLGKSAQKVGGVFLKKDSVVKDTELKDLGSFNYFPTQEALDLGLDILKHVDLRQSDAVCPEHWIFAEYDRLIPKEVINDLISIRPDAQITLLEKAGHAPFITHTDEFLEHATQFIDQIA